MTPVTIAPLAACVARPPAARLVARVVSRSSRAAWMPCVRDGDVPGMSAAMARDGNVVWERGFGFGRSRGRPAGDSGNPLPPLLAHEALRRRPPPPARRGRAASISGAPAADFEIELESDGDDPRGAPPLAHVGGQAGDEVLATAATGSRSSIGSSRRSRRSSFASLLRERVLDPIGLADAAPNPAQLASCREAGRDPDALAPTHGARVRLRWQDAGRSTGSTS